MAGIVSGVRSKGDDPEFDQAVADALNDLLDRVKALEQINTTQKKR